MTMMSVRGYRSRITSSLSGPLTFVTHTKGRKPEPDGKPLVLTDHACRCDRCIGPVRWGTLHPGVTRSNKRPRGHRTSQVTGAERPYGGWQIFELPKSNWRDHLE
jgi:hypothetical protein